MIDIEKVKELLENLESDYIEKTTSVREDKLGPAGCALANDFPNHKKSGYILVGIEDNGKIGGKRFSDKELKDIGNIKTNGNVLPPPSIVVSPIISFPEGDVIVIEVKPSEYPPVRYNGRCYIRTGPRKSIATLEEERILTERRISKTYDLFPVREATIDDLVLELFKTNYLPLAIDKEIIKENKRTIQEQLSSLRFYDLKNNCPTNAGILMFGVDPLFYLPGAYIQYVNFRGEEITDNVEYEKRFSGALITLLPQIDEFIKSNIIKEKPLKQNSFQEEIIVNYPYWALRELIMNAIMHRNYESNAPVYIYEYKKKIEIVNPGGLYGEVTKENFPNASDYRNVALAEALKVLGYVNKFNYGIRRASEELLKNGNGEPEFDLSLETKFKVTIKINSRW
ncbi:MAG: putative DNA binding domain-containing protein [Chitinispirillaceae bacterium]|nr:putative DNA binding domain-containing protein [Chitinispirillaceae bacterium]